MWNISDVPDPPCRTVKLPRAEAKVIATALKNICKDIAEMLANERALEKEMYITERFLYKQSNQFRHHKLLRSFKKINQCSKRWKSLTLGEYVNTVSGSINSISATYTYLPSWQMLECLMIKLIGAANLCHHFLAVIVETNLHVLDMFKLGHFVNQGLFIMANSSRLWVMMRGYLMEFIRLYSELKHVEHSFLQAHSEECTASTELPTDLNNLLPTGNKNILQSVTQADDKVHVNDSEIQTLSSNKDATFLEHIKMEDIGRPVTRQESPESGNLPETPEKTSIPDQIINKRNKKRKVSNQSLLESKGYSLPKDKSSGKTKGKQTRTKIPFEPASTASGKERLQTKTTLKIKPYLKLIKDTQSFKEISIILKDQSFVEAYPKAAKLQKMLKIVRAKLKKKPTQEKSEKLLAKTKILVCKALKK